MERLVRSAIAGALLCGAAAAGAGQKVDARLEKESVVVEVGGKIFARYQFVNRFGKKPYMWPLAGPVSGKSVTTESSEPYPHHNSMWFGCDHINGGDYWHHQNPNGKQRSLGPRVLVASGEKIVFEDIVDWNPPNGKTVMRDFRRVTVSAPDAETRIVDFVVVWVPLENVHITKTNHSLFALRMTPELSVDRGGTMVNSLGGTAAKGTFGIVAPWMDCFGTRDGVTEGAAILQHPSNRWYPSPWFTRDYGFFSPTPMFWLDKGGIDLPAGEPTTLAYRVVVHAGDTRKAHIADRFAHYAGETPVLPMAYVEDAMKRLKAVAAYKRGDSRKDLMAVEKVAARVSPSPEQRRAVAALIASLLPEGQATDAARHFACRQLALVGGDESVPALVSLLSGADEKLAGTACFALQRIPGPASCRALREALPRLKGRVRLAVITALGAKRDGEAVDLLRGALTAGDGTEREVAAAALGHIGTEGAVDALLAAWAKDDARGVALADAVLSGATRLLETGATVRAEKAFRSVYEQAPANWLKLAALRGLVTADPKTCDSLLGQALSSDDVAMRQGAIALIAEVPGKAVTRLAASRLAGLAPPEQIAMLSALERRGDRSAAQEVEGLLDASDAGVRAAACRALGTLGGPGAVPALAKRLGEDQDGREMAAAALSRLGGGAEVTSSLLNELRHASGDDVRQALVGILSERGDPAAAPELLKLVSNEALARDALKALENVATGTELKALIRMLDGDAMSETMRTWCESCVAGICRRLAGEGAASSPCLEALSDAKPAGRASLYRVLGRLQDEETLPRLVRGTSDADETVRDAAVRALVGWPRPSALEPILSVAKSTPSLTHHVLALRGYARLLKGMTDASPAELKPLFDAGAAVARRPEEKKMLTYEVSGVPLHDLSVKSKGAYKVHFGGLKKGARWSVDRDYVFEDVPTEVLGATYIESVMDDRTYGGSGFISFVVDEPVYVYVAYDNRCKQLPAWLKGWERPGSAIRPPDKTGCMLILHRKRFEKGKITLGGAKAPGCAAMYVVAVKKAK